MNKICLRCKKSLLLSLFYKDKYRKDGFTSYCKACDYSRQLSHGRQYLNTRITKRLALNREAMNDSYWKRIARRHEMNFERLKEIFKSQKEKCFYCKTSLKSKNLHVEHFYPQRKDKIVIACADCNRLKWQKNGDDFIKFLKEYISRFS